MLHHPKQLTIDVTQQQQTLSTFFTSVQTVRWEERCTHLKNVDYRLIIIPEIQHLKSLGGRWPIKRVLLSHL
jgi:hypothetical protein